MAPAAARLLLSFCFCLPLFANAWAQEWTRFRGPNGAGQSDAQGIPTKWTLEECNWRVKLPGTGHSSPVVWKDKVFLLSADPETATRYCICLHAATGQTAWTREFPTKPHRLHQFSSYASATPAVDADQVYFAWSDPEKTTLIAFDHNGATRWELDLGRWVSQHGFGTSPVLYEDMVILFNSQDNAEKLPPGEPGGESHMMAFDRRSGMERWRTPMQSTIVSYSVPFIHQPEGGKPELICTSTAEGVFSLDPHTGERNWAVPGFTMRTVSSPVIAGGLVFGTAGSGGGGNHLLAVRPGKNAELAYKIDRQANYVPSTIAHGDLVFLWSDKGIVTCIDAATGAEHWQERVGGDYFGSPIRVGDRLYCMNDDGEAVVLAAGKKFQELARNPLGEASHSTPAVSGGRMYLRTYSHLISVGGKSL